MNRVILMGNLTRDVEVRQAGASSVGQFSVAVNEKWKDRDGNMQERVTFVDCEAWGGTGENIAKFFSKGRQILIEGKLQLDQWEDKEGGKRSKLKVVVERFFFTGTKQDAGEPKQPTYSRGGGGASPEIDHDDIPF
jgi:single-strand DNA-binding protein